MGPSGRRAIPESEVGEVNGMIAWTEPDLVELRRRMVVGKLYVMVDVWPEHEEPIACAYCGAKSAPLNPELVALQLLTGQESEAMAGAGRRATHLVREKRAI